MHSTKITNYSDRIQQKRQYWRGTNRWIKCNVKLLCCNFQGLYDLCVDFGAV